jgi:hypothetical protein
MMPGMDGVPEVPRFGVFGWRLIPSAERAEGLSREVIEVEFTYRWWQGPRVAEKYRERTMRMLITPDEWRRLVRAVGE